MFGCEIGEEKMKPNAYACEGCPKWDDINGCWGNCKYVCDLGYSNDDGYFDEEEHDNQEKGC